MPPPPPHTHTNTHTACSAIQSLCEHTSIPNAITVLTTHNPCVAASKAWLLTLLVSTFFHVSANCVCCVGQWPCPHTTFCLSTLLPTCVYCVVCAVLCSGRAHIPVDQYQANLQSIVQKLLSSGVEHVVVMTPSPVYEGAAQAIPHGEVRSKTVLNGYYLLPEELTSSTHSSCCCLHGCTALDKPCAVWL
jgi:hypothetical protein